MMSNLDGLGYRGKTVIVTGGASGMGEAAARILGDLAQGYISSTSSPLNGAVTGTFLYTDQGFASGAFTGRSMRRR